MNKHNSYIIQSKYEIFLSVKPLSILFSTWYCKEIAFEAVQEMINKKEGKIEVENRKDVDGKFMMAEICVFKD